MELRGAVLLTPQSSLIEDMHLQWMRAAGRRPSSIRDRRAALARLAAAAGCLPHGVTVAGFDAFAKQRGEGIVPATWRKELTHYRAYFSWLVEAGYRSDDPTRRWPLPPLRRNVPRPVPDHRLREFLAAADDETRAMLLLGRLAALRAAEAAALAWPDVDLRERLILVRDGKGGRQDEVNVPQLLVDALEALPRRVGPVIRRQDGQGGHNLSTTISRRASAAMDREYTFHQLRHASATAVLAATGDVTLAARHLRHAGLANIMIYAKVRNERLRQAVESASSLTQDLAG